MKIGLIAPAVMLALLAIGCSSGDDAVAGPTTSAAAGLTEPAVAVAVPDVVGQGLKDARATLEAAGYAVVAADSLESRAILIESNWVVTDQTTDGTTVNLGAQKATDGQTAAPTTETPTTEPTDRPAAPSSATPSGLTSGIASVACDHVGDANYTYGFDASWIWDGNYVVEGDTVFLKAGAKIETAGGNKYRATVECRVSGTEGAPVVDEFYVYP